MEGKFFQRYHGRENTHSSNALMLLQRLYYYSPCKFYGVIENLFEVQGGDKLIPNFVTQDTDNGKGSIPDFTIQQLSFKLVVEAKENKFDMNQLERHLEGLSKLEEYKFKMLIALSPSNTVQGEIDELDKKYSDIHIIHKTYVELYDMIYDVLDKRRDFEFIDFLEDYRQYCVDEQLIDFSDDTVMARLASDTCEFNIKNGVYYDGANNNAYGFKYLALYENKSIRAIGKITKIIEAHEENGEIIYGETRFYTSDTKINESDKQKIRAAIMDRAQRYGNAGERHWHYLVEEFIEVDNFVKKSKYGLYGKKKFSLKNDFGIANYRKCTVKDIVESMNRLGGWE